MTGREQEWCSTCGVDLIGDERGRLDCPRCAAWWEAEWEKYDAGLAAAEADEQRNNFVRANISIDDLIADREAERLRLIVWTFICAGLFFGAAALVLATC